MGYEARGYQIAAKDAALETFGSGSPSTLVVLPTGCVAGDTIVGLNRAGKGYSRSIEYAYRKRNDGRVKHEIPTMIRSHLGDRIGLNAVRGIVASGVKRTCALLLANKKSIRATPDHEILTDGGWVALGDLREGVNVACESDPVTGRNRKPKNFYEVVQGLVGHPFAMGVSSVREGRLYRVATHRLVVEANMNGLSLVEFIRTCRRIDCGADKLKYLDPEVYAVHHKDRNHKNNNPENLQVMTHSDHHKEHGENEKLANLGYGIVEWSPVYSVSRYRPEPTYDIVCEDPHRNFVGNGIVVHNCGKTVLSAMIIEEFYHTTGRRSLFLAHRETLIDQAHDKFTSYGLDSAVEMAGQDFRANDALFGKTQVVVGSVPSMQGERLLRCDRREFGLVIVDETHHIEAGMHQNTVNYFEDKYLLGITATPKPSLGSIFKTKCYDYPLTTAIWGDGQDDPGGWLVAPYIRKAMVSVDLKGIRTSGGDYNIGDLEERLAPKLNEIADAIVANCGERQTVVFTPDCGSAQALSDLIQRKHGRSCEYVAGTGGKFGMSKNVRKEVLGRFNKSQFQILINCELLFEGWDCPQVKCVVVCRPTPRKMRYRYIQMVGRGLRLSPETGYNDCIVVDLDWQADDAGKNLTMLVDLFDDDERSDEVMDVARQIEAAMRAKSASQEADPSERLDPREIIEEAEEIVRVRTKLCIKVSPTIATVKTIDINPVGVGKLLDVKLSKKHDMDTRGNNPASPAQVGFLKSFGVERPEGFSSWGASKMLKKLVARRDAGLATVPQVKQLMEKGVLPDIARALTADSARQSLVELAKAELAVKKQGSLF